MLRLRIVFGLLTLATFLASSAAAEKRIALIIIMLLGKALGEVGFELLKPLKDASRDDTLDAVYELAERLRSAGSAAIGFLYYSGHGVAVSGENLLVPVNAEGTSERILAV